MALPLFQKLLDSCETDKNLVLGNGFGLSYDAAFNENNFSWNTLLDRCKIKKEEPLFQLLKNSHCDFELAQRKLRNACDIISLYSINNTLVNQLENQINSLRDQLVITVTNSHPDSFVNSNPSRGTECYEKVMHCREFIKSFLTIHSLNYDLLLYWVRCFSNESIIGCDSFISDPNQNDDLVFEENDNATFFYLHGALFLRRYQDSIIKTNWLPTDPILAQTKQNINEGKFPMCISEGTGKQKMDAIMNNSYLRFCYEKLGQCKGTIFTFGCSFRTGQDDHIIKAMLQSKAKEIVIGVYSPNEVVCQALDDEFNRVKKQYGIKKKHSVADTSTTKVW